MQSSKQTCNTLHYTEMCFCVSLSDLKVSKMVMQVNPQLSKTAAFMKVGFIAVLLLLDKCTCCNNWQLMTLSAVVF